MDFFLSVMLTQLQVKYLTTPESYSVARPLFSVFLCGFRHHKEKRKKAVWLRETNTIVGLPIDETC